MSFVCLFCLSLLCLHNVFPKASSVHSFGKQFTGYIKSTECILNVGFFSIVSYLDTLFNSVVLFLLDMNAKQAELVLARFK